MKFLFVVLGLLVTSSAYAACADSFTTLESAELRAEHAHGVATMVQGSMALLLADAVNHSGDPSDFHADTLVIWTEPDNNRATVVFMSGNCRTGEAVMLPQAFRGVLAAAYPKHPKMDRQPL